MRNNLTAFCDLCNRDCVRSYEGIGFRCTTLPRCGAHTVASNGMPLGSHLVAFRVGAVLLAMWQASVWGGLWQRHGGDTFS